MADLTGKVALVTGGGQGVGLGIAQALAAAGASVVLAGRTLKKVEDAAAAIIARGAKASVVACNVKDASDLAAIVDHTINTFGGLDILVNNAQEVPLGRLDEV